MSAIAEHAAPSRKWREQLPERPFWPYFVASLFFNVGFAAYFFLYNVYLAQQGVGEVRIGRIAAALSLGTVTGTLPAGYAASRFGARNTLLTALPLAALAAAARVLFSAYPAQLIFGFFIGATLCSWGVCLGPSVTHLTTERTRPTAFSILFAAGIGITGIGSVLAGHVPSFLQRAYALSPGQSVRSTLILACASVFAALFPLSFVKQGPLQQAPPALQTPGRFLRRFLLAIVLWSFVGGALSTFAAVYFTRSLSVPLPRLGDIFFFSQIAQCIGVLTAPLLMRKLSFGASIMYTQLASAASLALLAFTHSPQHAMVLYWGYLAAVYMSEPALFALLMRHMPDAGRPQASAWHMLTASLTQSVTATLTGAAIAATGYKATFLALALAGAAAGLLLRYIAQQPTPESGSTES